MSDTTPAPTVGWHEYQGQQAYFDGQKWTWKDGTLIAAKTVIAAPTATPPSRTTYGPDWPVVVGILAIIVGGIAFLVPPYSSDSGYGSVVNFPAMFLQYGAALALVLSGTLFLCTGAAIKYLIPQRVR